MSPVPRECIRGQRAFTSDTRCLMLMILYHVHLFVVCMPASVDTFAVCFHTDNQTMKDRNLCIIYTFMFSIGREGMTTLLLGEERNMFRASRVGSCTAGEYACVLGVRMYLCQLNPCTPTTTTSLSGSRTISNYNNNFMQSISRHVSVYQ